MSARAQPILLRRHQQDGQRTNLLARPVSVGRWHALTAQRDGGYWALSGYLYQILGVLGMQATASSPDNGVNSGQLGIMLTAVRNPNIRHEIWGQDAALEGLGLKGDDQCVLIQFKYSNQPTSHPLAPAELRDIGDAFVRSGQAASVNGSTVTGHALISNRSPTALAIQLCKRRHTSRVFGRC